MKVKALLLTMTAGLLLPLVPAQGIILEEIYNPSALLFDTDFLYVIQDVEVFVFSRTDFSPVSRFGRAGEGPQEFVRIQMPWFPSLSLYLQDDHLMINSLNKISQFSKSGHFIQEMATHHAYARYIPCGDHYFMMNLQQEEGINQVVVSLVDRDLKNGNVVCKVKFPEQDGRKRNPILMARMSSYFDRHISRDRLVLPLGNGAIRIFDCSGAELANFAPPYTRVKLTADRKRELDQFFLNDTRYKRPYSVDRSRGLIDFGDELPPLNSYRLDGDTIYIVSSHQTSRGYETFVYGFDGTMKKRIFLPLVDLDMFDVYPYAVSEGVLYQAVYDEDEEACRLVITDLD